MNIKWKCYVLQVELTMFHVFYSRVSGFILEILGY